ncbi:MAG: GFA family protein [Alphaproteobacteria bacterium]|nr:GFA family protein [Alphaproteobacteria bacterium]
MQGLCHCRNCQRLSGGGHVGFICFPESAATVEGETRSYGVTGGSGHLATRYSCPICHAIVFGRSDVILGKINFYAGSLDDASLFKPTIAIFVRSRPPWDDSSRALVCYDTLPG